MRKIHFVLYSYPIQEEFKDTTLYEKAIASGALISVNSYNNELLLSKVTDELVKATIDSHIEDTEPTNYEEELMSFEGGLRIEQDDTVIEYQCCTDLSDYTEWEKVISKKSQQWEQIWIGHPWIYYRYNGVNIEFSEYYDDTPNAEDIQTKMICSRGEFVNELQQALSELEMFKERLCKIIDNGNYDHKEVLKRKLMA
ncbi:hypothetical protein [uncultured Kordia sp.]|uniref:hypothetical protein n=1 Tax=uncultured Kordia sp. TaxID=507699 RepID=UPI0026127976|nr:hypothetical protein [uncultured Kordia sp.]